MITFDSSTDSNYSISGSVAVGEEKILYAKLCEVLSKSTVERVCVDLRGLESVSSVVLAVLLAGIRKAHSQKRELVFENMSDDLFNMARVGGVESILCVLE